MAPPDRLAAALQHLSLGAWQQAEIVAKAAVMNDPDDPHAALLMGLAIAAMGEDIRAAPVMVRVAAERPGADHPCLELAALTPPLPRALITRQFRACLRLAPDDDRLRLDFATFLLEAGQVAEAETVLAGAPDSAAGYHLMGLIQAELGHFLAAIACFDHAVAMDPAAAASWSNLGMMLKVEGRFAEAVAAHDHAVASTPANHRFRVNRAVTLLKMGQWEAAWRDYESRLALTDAPPIDRGRLMPSLAAGQRLTGVTVMALHEDGFGDTLQFLRYLPLLADRGATVVACVPPALERIMHRVPGVAAVETDCGRLPSHDFVCPMFSLPRVFGTNVDTIPPVPLLVSDATLVRQWAGRLPRGGLRVGLVWAGQARPTLPGFATVDRRRSAGLATFAPLFGAPGVSFVSLQAGPAARQARALGVAMTDPMPDASDFADTAAIIAGLDVVVSVDTSVVHLAGLVRKPVFLLDRYDGCWRWLSGRSDSPWYPGLTIFRQDQPDDWSGPMAKAAASLRTMAACRNLGSSSAGTRQPAFVA
ncbi:MAG TPA: tetratricopeptide repeat protein [Rhodopila sp.]|jgi:Tfp pilus assembly protein PilF